MTKTRKAFDCVAMKREGAACVYELTKNMTRAEELAFWKAEAAKLLPKPLRTRRQASSMRSA